MHHPTPGALAPVRVIVSRSIYAYPAPSVPLAGTARFHRRAVYTRCLRCAGAPFYVDEHNRVLPHSAFRGQTPDEMYFGTGDAVPTDLTARAAAARRTRGEANRSASCATCPSVDAAA